MRKLLLAFALASLASTAPSAPAQSPIAAAVANPARDPMNVKLDEGRKPAQLLAFLGVRRGMHVLDLFGGNRYWAEIIVPVIGPKGSYVVWEPSQFYSPKTKAAFEAFAAKIPNVSIAVSPFDAP